ncbi:MAG: hypothetical protein M0P64_00555 [Candidatus Pacebacteria bacterium]|jgi:hypothetical protein|nr:hypothetical protein [Candidatus Paceibacterota bacterium]
MFCAYCKKEIRGPYITVIVDAAKKDFCNEEHSYKYFKEQDRIILEEFAQSQKTPEQK